MAQTAGKKAKGRRSFVKIANVWHSKFKRGDTVTLKRGRNRTELVIVSVLSSKADGTVYSGSDPPTAERVDGTLATEDDLEEMAKG